MPILTNSRISQGTIVTKCWEMRAAIIITGCWEMGAAIIRKVFGVNSSFHVKKRTMGKV